MAEDFDVEAMLEAPYRKDEEQQQQQQQPTLGSHNGGHHNRRDNNGNNDQRKRSSVSPDGRDSDQMMTVDDNSPRDTADTARQSQRSSHRERDREAICSASRRSEKDEQVQPRSEQRNRSRDREQPRSGGGKQRGASKEKERGERRRSRSRERRRRSRSRDKKVRRSSRSRERRRSKSRERGAERVAERVAERGAERRRSRSPGHRGAKRHSPSSRRRSRTPPRRHRSPSPRPFRRGRTPPNGLGNRSPPEDLSPEERDARTVFCMQLSQRIRARDLEEFFSSVGKVRDVRLITCNKTKRFKGIAYIEFKDPESVPLALGLSGQRLLGIPISVQHTQAEKNRMANTLPNLQPPKNHVGPMRLYVGSLHFNITEDMLRGIFEPFGKIDSIQLIMDPETNRSKGYGFITFHNADDAKKALEQLNGFELAGRPMKVGNVTERLDVNTNASLDTDEMDRSGIDLGATGRLQLMFKLAEGAGLAVPQAAANALLASAPQPPAQPVQPTPSIATQCFLLSNMFDPGTETNPTWDVEITDDVIEECKKHGGILHVYVDRASQGNVYVKCPSIATAVLAVNSLHGRWFAGRVITAAYVPLVNYHALFPDALAAQLLLSTSKKA